MAQYMLYRCEPFGQSVSVLGHGWRAKRRGMPLSFPHSCGGRVPAHAGSPVCCHRTIARTGHDNGAGEARSWLVAHASHPYADLGLGTDLDPGQRVRRPIQWQLLEKFFEPEQGGGSGSVGRPIVENVGTVRVVLIIPSVFGVQGKILAFIVVRGYAPARFRTSPRYGSVQGVDAGDKPHSATWEWASGEPPGLRSGFGMMVLRL